MILFVILIALLWNFSCATATSLKMKGKFSNLLSLLYLVFLKLVGHLDLEINNTGILVEIGTSMVHGAVVG